MIPILCIFFLRCTASCRLTVILTEECAQRRARVLSTFTTQNRAEKGFGSLRSPTPSRNLRLSHGSSPCNIDEGNLTYTLTEENLLASRLHLLGDDTRSWSCTEILSGPSRPLVISGSLRVPEATSRPLTASFTATSPEGLQTSLYENLQLQSNANFTVPQIFKGDIKSQESHSLIRAMSC
ncbi:hypothetical protein CIB48_g9545 [Xylaria polymorpha]|nr:hypothetical protein CIB48_g9545 [Xylaria polymorpha]